MRNLSSASAPATVWSLAKSTSPRLIAARLSSFMATGCRMKKLTSVPMRPRT